MKKHIAKLLLPVILAIAVLIGVLGSISSGKESELSEKLIRLHIVANSDSEKDQAIKLAVKDEILSLVSGLTCSASDSDEAETALRNNLPRIIEAANSVLAENGSSYGAKAALAAYEFPTKSYGLFSLPAGSYKALRVELGQGGGRNWWCVLFPPLCNAASDEEFIKAANDAGLSGDEVCFMTKNGGKSIIRFRLAELFAYVKSLFS